MCLKMEEERKGFIMNHNESTFIVKSEEERKEKRLRGSRRIVRIITTFLYFYF